MEAGQSAEHWYLTEGIVYEFLRVATHPRVFARPLAKRQALAFLEPFWNAPTFTILTAGDRHWELLKQEVLAIPHPVGNLFFDIRTLVLMREHGIDAMALIRSVEQLARCKLNITEDALAAIRLEAVHSEALAIAERYAAWALHAAGGRARHGQGILFRLPAKSDPAHLVPVESVTVGDAPAMRLPEHHQRLRDGFDLTDQGTDLAGALDQANYCIWCHHQGKDSCSKGLTDRKTGAFQKSPFGVALGGCPLEEKISEMHSAMVAGQPLAALAIAVIDNPLVAGTGHRICNDCMKACIYQKQQPVDIPQAETRNLKEVLHLPWGFEIYGLLSRWSRPATPCRTICSTKATPWSASTA